METFKSNGGDDLEDNLYLSPVEDSEPETEFPTEEKTQESESNITEEPTEKKTKKRKRDQETKEIVSRNPTNQLEFLMKHYFSFKKPTSLELSQMNITPKSIVDISSTQTLEESIKKSTPHWKKTLSWNKLSPQKSPSIIIICSSAMRCINLIKTLPQLNKLNKIGKLFSKHNKIQDQIEEMNEKNYSIIVGTPARIMKIHEEIGLFDKLKLVVIDMDKDVKNRTLFDIQECRNEFFELFDGFLFSLVQNNKTKLIMF